MSNGVQITTTYVPNFSKLYTHDNLTGNIIIYSGDFGGEYSKVCETITNIQSYHKNNKTGKIQNISTKKSPPTQIVRSERSIINRTNEPPSQDFLKEIKTNTRKRYQK